MLKKLVNYFKTQKDELADDDRLENELLEDINRDKKLIKDIENILKENE
jgi:hypothetical protein